MLLPYSQTEFSLLYDTFLAALREQGFAEGRDVSIEARWAEGKPDRLAPLAMEVAARKPAVILTASSAGVAAAMKATSSIPVVFATAFDPVGQRFVSSLRRPGGNVTGVLVYVDLSPKMVEIAREALPAARRLAVLIHEADPAHRYVLEGFESTARRFKFEPILVRVAGVGDFDRAFGELVRQKAEAFVVPLLSLFTGNHRQLVERALKVRLPLLSSQSFIAENGGFLSYGTLTEENYRRAAALVAKILHGANPAELPVEQPEKFLLIVNMKTAKAIGVKLSANTLLRADRVIE